MTARNLSQEMAESVITLDTMQRTEKMERVSWPGWPGWQFTCVENSNLAEYRWQIVLMFLTQFPVADQSIKLPVCQHGNSVFSFNKECLRQ